MCPVRTALTSTKLVVVSASERTNMLLWSVPNTRLQRSSPSPMMDSNTCMMVPSCATRVRVPQLPWELEQGQVLGFGGG